MRKHQLLSLLTLALTSIVSTVALANDRPCSTAAVAGGWGHTTSGVIVGLGPVAAVGKVNVDTAGNVAGTQTRSFNGVIAQETLTGKISVASDCTLTMVVQVFQNGTLVRTTNLSGVLDDRNNQLRMIFLTPNTVITLEGQRAVSE